MSSCDYVVAVEWDLLSVFCYFAFCSMLLWCFQQEKNAFLDDILLSLDPQGQWGWGDECPSKSYPPGGIWCTSLTLTLQEKVHYKVHFGWSDNEKFLSFNTHLKCLSTSKLFPSNSSRFWNRHAALSQQSRSKDFDFCNGCKSRLVVLNKQILVPSQLNWSTTIGCRLGWCG